MEICNCRHCGTGKRWWVKWANSYKCPHCDKDPEKVSNDELYEKVENLTKQVSALEREKRITDSLIYRDRASFEKLRDLVCDHAEVRYVPPICRLTVYGEPNRSSDTRYICVRCGKEIDPCSIGREELEKRIKKEG
ncbi:MAG: hypothetical protein WC455_18930 [Dehalococcoidia bacterium]|jgi:hypothetical protein